MSTASTEATPAVAGARSGADSIASLTGVRFIAAFTIAAGHLYTRVADLTLIGMPLFFTLSGFIIHYVYSATFVRGWRPAALAFAGARFSRIYPLYALLLLVSLVDTPMGTTLYENHDVSASLAYVLACWSWLPLPVGGTTAQNWYYSVSWSVPTEIFFYIAYALALYRLAAIRSARACFVTLAIFCASVYALFYVLFVTRDAWEPVGLAYFPGMTARGVDFQNSFYRWFLYFSPYCRIFEFIGGCLTCQLFLLLRRERWMPRRAQVALMGWAAVALTLAILGLFHWLGPREPWLAPDRYGFASFFMTLHMNFLLAPVCYLLLFALASGGGTILARLLATRVAVLLGEISYSTYLGHLLAIGFAVRIDGPHVNTLARLAAAYLLSLVLYNGVEVPAKAALRRFFARWSGVPPRAAVARASGD